MADLVLDIDWDITKAEAKQRKLNREFDISQRKAGLIKDKIDELNSALDDEKTKQSDLIEQMREQNKEAGKLAAAIDKVKSGTATPQEVIDLGSISEAETKLEEMTKAAQRTNAEYVKSCDTHKKIEAEISKQNYELDKQNNKTAEIGDKILLNSKKQNKFTQAFQKSQKSADRFGKRLKSLIASALFFSVVTKAFTALRNEFGKLITETGTKTAALVSQLKNNLTVLGRTLYESAKPYIEWVLEKLVHITQLLTIAIAKALGKNVEEMQALAKATEDTGKNADKATAGFDTLQKLNASSGSDDSAATSATVSTSDEELKETEAWLRRIAPFVTAIGLGFAAWNIINFLKQFETLNNYLTGGKITGILMIVVGLVLLIWNYCDAWVNGIDWANFAGIIAGIALVVGGLALVFGSIGAGIGAIVGGVAMVVLGIKDWIENGKSLQSVLTVVVGILAIGLGLMLLGLGWPALMVAAIVAAIVLIAAYWDEIKTAVSKFIDWFSENVLDKLFGKGVGNALRGMWKSFTLFFEDFIAFFKNVFTGKWKEAGKSFVNIFIDLVNFGINKLNSFIQGLLGGGAKLINAFGKLFGQKWNLDASHIKIPDIPRLATGMILPGGSPMLAWVNDQPKGQPYLEGSIDNIAAAFDKYLGGRSFGNQNINLIAKGPLAPLIRLLALEIQNENERTSVF